MVIFLLQLGKVLGFSQHSVSGFVKRHAPGLGHAGLVDRFGQWYLLRLDTIGLKRVLGRFFSDGHRTIRATRKGLKMPIPGRETISHRRKNAPSNAGQQKSPTRGLGGVVRGC